MFKDKMIEFGIYGTKIEYFLEYENVLYMFTHDNFDIKNDIRMFIQKLIQHFYNNGYKEIISVTKEHQWFRTRYISSKKDKDSILKSLDNYLFYDVEDKLKIESLILTTMFNQDNLIVRDEFNSYLNSFVIKKNIDGIGIHFIANNNSKEKEFFVNFCQENKFNIIN